MSTGSSVPTEASDEQQDLFLTFHLNGEDYGFAINHVIEIIGIQKITQVPDMPEFIKGVINLRGRVIPVMDVRLRFNMEEKSHDERTCVIVVQVEESITGLIVDRVNEVQEIPAGMIEPPPKTGIGNDYLRGIGKVGDEVKILLDVEALLQYDEAEAVPEVA